MSHFRVDDGLDSHPKAQRAGDEALGMWTRAGAWCMRYLTDGFVPSWWVKQQPKGIVKARRLVDAGLWHPTESGGEKGWQFHEFVGVGRQDSRAKIEAERSRWREKKAGQRDTSSPRLSPGDTRGLSPGDTRGLSPGDTRGLSPGDTRGLSPGESLHVTRDPTQPITNETSGYVHSARYEPNADEPRSAPVRPAANRLIAEIIPAEHPPATQTELRLQTSALLTAGQPPEIVAEALRLWTTKRVHPKTLPSLVSELINTRNHPPSTGTEPSTASKTPPSKRKVNAALNLAAQFADQPPTPSTPRALEA